jgi:hypothetical protein
VLIKTAPRSITLAPVPRSQSPARRHAAQLPPLLAHTEMCRPPLNPVFPFLCAFRISTLQTAISNSANPRAAALGVGLEGATLLKTPALSYFRHLFA